MVEKKLESFKISDTQRPTVGRAKAKTHEDPAVSQSLGFARIEKMLENENPESVQENLSNLLKSLEEFQGKATTPKDKAAGKKAIAAVERTTDLMEYLFQTKQSLQENQAAK